jgi:hypothetical protein
MVLHCLLFHRMRRFAYSHGHKLKVRRHLGKVVSLAIVGFHRYYRGPLCRSPEEFRALPEHKARLRHLHSKREDTGSS